MQKELRLGELTTRYVDFATFDKEVIITGTYKGDRLVFKNASNHILLFQEALIKSTRQEADKDGIAFDGELVNCTIAGDDFNIHHGGLSFWGRLENVDISGVNICYANQAIRMSGDFANKNVSIRHCNIICPEREGIYFGPHYEQKDKSNQLTICKNRIENAGWDAIQFNCLNTRVYDNTIYSAAVLEEKDQWFGILAHPGSTGHIYNNTITDTKRPYGVLDSRIFFYPKDLK